MRRKEIPVLWQAKHRPKRPQLIFFSNSTCEVTNLGNKKKHFLKTISLSAAIKLHQLHTRVDGEKETLHQQIWTLPNHG